ncbi:HNH endonuclease [Zhihengliuella salsuginis]|uniref:HNH nuclease domain-containing protein n=1 Tax=Zhihengliuella salsuginis TaxID=578222 RepID=A0ABQ3GB56_9MICC|nr:HNH endonuclease signature motif containing protein [Zhihengliuella salsuginis]GHC99230.1 hypothetical protein GCM10008096_01160 [Zhihengliuella salsuginis]
MAHSQRFRFRIGDAVLDLEPAAPDEPSPAGRKALEVAAESLGPQGLLVFAEQLRCFAEAASYEAAVRLETSAQEALAADLEEVAASSEGMARSVNAGRLASTAPEQAVAQEIASVRGIARQSAARELSRARVLVGEVPAVLEALAAGETGPAHARTVVDLAAKIVPADVAAPDEGDPAAVEEHQRTLQSARDECRAQRRRFCADVLDRATGKTPGQLERHGKRRLERELDEPFGVRHGRARADRFVAVEPDENGMCYLTAYIPTAAAEAIDRRLAEYAAAQTNPATRTRPALQDGPAAGSTPRIDANDNGQGLGEWGLEDDAEEGGEPRTARQVRADAFVDMLLSGPEAAGLANVKPLVTITVPATLLATLDRTAADHSGAGGSAGTTPEPAAGEFDGAAADHPAATSGLAETERFGAFDISELERLLPQSSTWTRVVTDPWSGEITRFDADAYRPTAAMRRALALRDRTCRVPGCGRRASACEPDHVIEFQHGGRTRLENLVSLCKRCHRLKSWGLLTFDLQPDGTLEVETFWGTRRVTLPDSPWAAVPDRAKRQLSTMIRARTLKIDTGQPGTDLFKHGPGLILTSLGHRRRGRARASGRDEEFARLVAGMEHRLVEFLRPCPF